MSTETTSGMGIRLLFNAARQNGVSELEIKRLTGIVSEHLEDTDMRFPVRMVKKLATIAFEASDDSALGLHLSKNYREMPYKLLTHIALNSANMLEAINYWARYAKLDSDRYQIEIREEANIFVIRYLNYSEYQAIWLQEYHLSQVLVNCHIYIDENIRPVEVRVVHDAPDYVAEYNALFQAPIVFNADENAIVFQKYDMLRPIPAANQFLKEVLIQQADTMVRNIDGNALFTNQIRVFIVKNLSNKKANVKSLCRALNIDRTTLQRKLKEEGTSFSRILDNTRQLLSVSYLKEDFQIKNISHLLGYSEPSAFQHKFKQWFGISPGLYRSNTLDVHKNKSE